MYNTFLSRAIGLILLGLSGAAQANMQPGAEGLLLILLNSWLMIPLFLVELALCIMRFFNTRFRRNLFLALNLIPALLTSFGLIRFISAKPDIDIAWLLIPLMLLSHLFCIAMPMLQYKILSRES